MYTIQLQWSYGVTLWEIMSKGAKPSYPKGLGIEDQFNHLKANRRLERPEACPTLMSDTHFFTYIFHVNVLLNHRSFYSYQLMRECWEFDPAQRPTFEEICEKLGETVRCLEQSFADESVELEEEPEDSKPPVPKRRKNVAH